MSTAAGEQHVAIVTGAGSGIGRAICLRLASDGVIVAAVDVNQQHVDETVGLLSSSGGRGRAFPVDVTSKQQVHDMVEAVEAAWKRVDILVNCAGIFPHTAIIDLDEAEWDRVIAVHVKGTLLCSQRALRTMMGQRSGSIVNLVSGLAHSGQAGTAAYAAAKGAIISFTYVLAKEAEPFGIRVNAFGPGITDTPMVRDANTPEGVEWLKKTSPFGRLATPEEAAEMAVWFTRPGIGNITGRVFL